MDYSASVPALPPPSPPLPKAIELGYIDVEILGDNLDRTSHRLSVTSTEEYGYATIVPKEKREKNLT